MATLPTAVSSLAGISFGDGPTPADNEILISGNHVYDSQQLVDFLLGGTDGTGGLTGASISSTDLVKGTTTITSTATGAETIVVADEGTVRINAKKADSADAIFGSSDDNIITGKKAGSSVIFGMDGNDTIKAFGGSNELHGNGGNDKITGGNGNDVIYGDAGNDVLKGGAGNDKIEGGTGKDNINGGAGDDTIHGGLGDDTLKGAGGADTFTFSASDGKQDDVILDFGKGGNDKITLDGLTITGHSYDAVQKGMLVSLSDGSTILLKGITEKKYDQHIDEKPDHTGLDWS